MEREKRDGVRIGGREMEIEKEARRDGERESGVRPRGTKENSGTSLHLPGRV